jgi:hypothetical protein
MNDQEIYESAPRGAVATIGFYFHLMTYSLITLILFGIYMINPQSSLWFEFPFLGWGIGLLIHGLLVFAMAGAWVKERFSEEVSKVYSL